MKKDNSCGDTYGGIMGANLYGVLMFSLFFSSVCFSFPGSECLGWRWAFGILELVGFFGSMSCDESKWALGYFPLGVLFPRSCCLSPCSAFWAVPLPIVESRDSWLGIACGVLGREGADREGLGAR